MKLSLPTPYALAVLALTGSLVALPSASAVLRGDSTADAGASAGSDASLLIAKHRRDVADPSRRRNTKSGSKGQAPPAAKRGPPDATGVLTLTSRPNLGRFPGRFPICFDDFCDDCPDCDDRRLEEDGSTAADRATANGGVKEEDVSVDDDASAAERDRKLFLGDDSGLGDIVGGLGELVDFIIDGLEFLPFLFGGLADMQMGVRGCVFQFPDPTTTPVVITDAADPTTRMECIGDTCNYDFKPQASIKLKAPMIQDRSTGENKASFYFLITCPRSSNGRGRRTLQEEGGAQRKVQGEKKKQNRARKLNHNSGSRSTIFDGRGNPGEFDFTPEFVWMCPSVTSEAGITVRRRANIVVRVSDLDDVDRESGPPKLITGTSASSVSYMQLRDRDRDGTFEVELSCTDEI
mmetsp:Transcript_3833/g.10764  ORF Transcript_3833/g.10764 Transcript_3833/m.10764 type:complete len:407 (+) Transcript_3833:124-1344(+)|eukprot:CAMPEP_0119558368 /NCGR_PEP_ID=MMETSP1352-20130426/10732_1 /TAXON_ID=265584 /ORGANISM="Stauroneis constricta, Strain CCMP1120" /LENGTH=406 /DNA_ID=CAMNT_0007605711 /DNA_START=103 /DNA_END=1323 /DNA_ORIENTATION=+